jgi:hypothetical protein
VLDVQECPAMDLALAGLLVETLRLLCAEAWSGLPALQAWRTGDLARYYDAAVAGAERTEVHDGAYLRALGMTRSSARIGQAWEHLADRVAAGGGLDAATGRLLEHYLRGGTLANRIVRALPREPQRADLERIYRGLCDCLAAGEPF